MKIDSPPTSRRTTRILLATLVISWLGYAGVVATGQSLHEEPSGGTSLLAILGLFGVCFACYLVALSTAVRAPRGRSLVVLLWIGAVGFRLTMLLSDPIEELDLYRYMWDGAVANRGVSPFRYSPQQVLAHLNEETSPSAPRNAELARLVNLARDSASLRAILDRIHFPELPTVYPPVAQWMFRVGDTLTPESASVRARMGVFRLLFVVCDLATLAIVMWLLRATRRAPGWGLSYAWCPLLIKEVANSGHLDAWALFWTAAGAGLFLRGGFGPRPTSTGRPRSGRPIRDWIAASRVPAALCLGLAVGAKLYALVLAPLWGWTILRRQGWTHAVPWFATFWGVTLVVLWPMVPRPGQSWAPLDAPEVAGGDEIIPLPPADLGTQARDPTQGLRAFLGEWEMNDFLFLLVMENVRPARARDTLPPAWFSIVPQAWRLAWVRALQTTWDISAERAPFLLARGITTLAYLLIALGIGCRVGSTTSDVDWLRASFLTLAWFWLLLPTLNPWYWTWTLPFLPFARSRAWFALSGLAFVYYLRFYLVAHFPGQRLLGSPYCGDLFFDYVVTWLEFAPWFAWLALEAWRCHARGGRS